MLSCSISEGSSLTSDLGQADQHILPSHPRILRQHLSH